MNAADLNDDFTAKALGKRLARIRESAGLKQVDLARRVTWSQAVLSRVEAGDREVSHDELAVLLDQIGTAEAAALRSILARQWLHLPTPPLDHADQDLLWAAENVYAALSQQAEAEDVRPAFSRRIQEYQAELERASIQLLKREHNVAFIGAIGIGKSTAICRATGLEVESPEGNRVPVLETGGGGITLCEVSLKVGPAYGVVVTARTAEEIRNDVADFAELLLGRGGLEPTSDDSDDSQRGVPRELERAIRNLSDLRQSRAKGADGKFVRSDPALTLAAELSSARELTVEILSRMDLPRRDQRESWHDPAVDKGPLEWLKETFEQINNGRHPSFSLPAHIDLIVPALPDFGDLSVTIVDTRGIDRVSARADLESHLLDPHTVSIMCSGFNDAPSQPIQHLLERATQIGNPIVASHSGVLVLARPQEALAVKDESGIVAESDEEGYDLKGEQVSAALAPLRLQELPVEFYNAFGDDPDRLRNYMSARIEAARSRFREELAEIIRSAHELLANVELSQVLEVQREAGHLVATWIEEHKNPPAVAAHVHDTLMSEIRRAHASAINAAVRREGEWYSLSYSHHLGFGARRVAVSSLRDWLVGFKDICSTLSVSHSDAAELLGQAGRLMNQSYEDLLRKMQVAGSELYRDDLQSAQALWSTLMGEWGRGPGYRDRVAAHQGSWFATDKPREIENEIRSILEREWAAVRSRLAAIFDTE